MKEAKSVHVFQVQYRLCLPPPDYYVWHGRPPMQAHGSSGLASILLSGSYPSFRATIYVPEDISHPGRLEDLLE